MNENNRPLKLLALSGNIPLAERISNDLDIPLTKVNREKFADGEIRINISESVRGSNVYIIQSTSGTEDDSVNDNIIELLVTIDALRRASVNEITVVMPYYGYSRQDRKARSREPITARVVADLYERIGTNRIMTFDLHASQIQGFFDIPMDHLSAAPILAEYLLENNLVDENTVIVSPDHGGVTRARNLINYLGLNSPLAIIDKKRSVDKKNTVEVMDIVGNVKGKNVIIIDDIIDTGRTIVKSAEALLNNGANKVDIVATHAVLSNGASQRLQDSKFEKVIVTDSINIPEGKMFDKLSIISSSNLFSKAINAVENKESVSPLFQKKNK